MKRSLPSRNALSARSAAALLTLLAAGAAFACGSSSNGGSDPGSSGAGTRANEAGAGSTSSDGGRGGQASGTAGGKDGNDGSGGSNVFGTAGTVGSIGGAGSVGGTQCSNGIDDDGDGNIDGFDAECTGPFDNDEGTFATGIPGDNRDPKWQDCFFDGNSGAGDDGCRYSTGCLDGSLEQDDPKCTLTQSCVDFCARLTPNGCDCFGCCTLQLPDGSTVDALETSSCSLDKLGDEEACPRCTKSTQCGNTCGECELCPGKTVADLPAKCTPPQGTGGASGYGGAAATGGANNAGNGSYGGASAAGGAPSYGGAPPAYVCDNGEPTCGAGLPECDSLHYCSFGCCLEIVR